MINFRSLVPAEAVSTLDFSTTPIMFIVLGISLVLLLLAGPIQKAIGDSGASIVSRVMGLILASVAIDSILTGIKVYFVL